MNTQPTDRPWHHAKPGESWQLHLRNRTTTRAEVITGVTPDRDQGSHGSLEITEPPREGVSDLGPIVCAPST